MKSVKLYSLLSNDLEKINKVRWIIKQLIRIEDKNEVEDQIDYYVSEDTDNITNENKEKNNIFYRKNRVKCLNTEWYDHKQPQNWF